MAKLDDPNEVEAQYRDSTNLDARVKIYELFSSNPVPWLSWVYDRLAVHPGERVLDVGCGTGSIWRHNADRLPGDLSLTLADQSQGMLDEAQARLQATAIDARFDVADIGRLPYASDAFDLVIANHVLYHVPDRLAALRELRRVAGPTGRCIVSTNDWTHLIELRELVTRFQLPTAMRRVGREPDFFDAERAAEELAALFGSVVAARRHDVLDVSDADVLVGYVSSMIPDAPHDPEALERLRVHAKEQIARMGALRITTSSIVFEVRTAH